MGVNKLSIVLNTYNEAPELASALKSVKDIANEIVIVDMGSTDETLKTARKFGAKTYNHKKIDYVEPARNFGISKASFDWVLILDPDEEVSNDLAKKIREILKNPEADYYRIPRKNIIFGHFMKYTRWWPDYNIRLFRKGSVSWNEVIHTIPMTQGNGAELEAQENLAIIHNNYSSIDDYLARMVRYTKIQSENIVKNGYKFDWKDLVNKPVGEFLGRYFVGQGYKDGIHGLALSLLQGFSELVIYIRVWEREKYYQKEIKKRDVKEIFERNIREINWWLGKELSWLKNYLKFW